MDNTITPVTTSQPRTTINRQRHKNFVSWSGYAALGFGTICGATGFRKVKIPQKRNIHKYSAYLAGITSFLHFGFAKGLDRIFEKKQ